MPLRGALAAGCSEARSLSVVLIDQGRVFAEGAPEDFIRNPNERLQPFLAKPYD